jgi:RNA-directed DNA polymerase
VIQTAAKLVLEPIFEADLEPNAYGYRPKRSALDAIRTVHELLCKGYTDVVDADLSKYFDTIPHGELMKCVARRIVDRNVLRLIKLWLKAPVESGDKGDRGRMSGGRKSKKGTPQGGVISPLLRVKGCNEVFRAQVVSYADDFVILSRGKADEALQWTSAVMDRLGLKLNQDKTAVRDASNGNFDFLGYTFGRIWFRKNGRWYIGASPSKTSVKRLKQKVRTMLRPGEKGAWPDVRDRLNALLRGWSTYFGYGTTQIAYRAVERNVATAQRR